MSNFTFVRNAYNKNAEFYINKRDDKKSSFYNEYLSNYQLKNHLKYEIKNKRVLYVGCGHGSFTNELYNMGAKIEGIDISDKMIENAKKNYKHIKFSISNANKTRFKDKTFDIVTANLIAHYFKDLSELFSEVSRIIRHKGIFLFSIHHPFNEVFQKEKNGNEIRLLLGPYFHNRKYFWSIKNMKLISYHHTFTDISGKLKVAGFYIEEIEESRAPVQARSINKEDHKFSNEYPTF